MTDQTPAVPMRMALKIVVGAYIGGMNLILICSLIRLCLIRICLIRLCFSPRDGVSLSSQGPGVLGGQSPSGPGILPVTEWSIGFVVGHSHIAHVLKSQRMPLAKA